MTNSVQGWKRRGDLGEAKAPLERVEQANLARFLDGIGVLWYHPANGGDRGAHVINRKGKRTSINAAILKGQGVKPGVPDIIILDAPKRWFPQTCVCPSPNCWKHGREAARPALLYDSHTITPLALEKLGIERPIGVAIELKRQNATPSSISVEQFAWMRGLANRGWYCCVARGAREAQDELRKLGYWEGA